MNTPANRSDPVSPAAHYPPLTFDPDEYRAGLKDLQLTKEQEDELLLTLWKIIATFVDMGWGVEDTQRVLRQTFEDSGNASDSSL